MPLGATTTRQQHWSSRSGTYSDTRLKSPVSPCLLGGGQSVSVAVDASPIMSNSASLERVDISFHRQRRWERTVLQEILCFVSDMASSGPTLVFERHRTGTLRGGWYFHGPPLLFDGSTGSDGRPIRLLGRGRFPGRYGLINNNNSNPLSCSERSDALVSRSALGSSRNGAENSPANPCRNSHD